MSVRRDGSRSRCCGLGQQRNSGRTTEETDRRRTMHAYIRSTILVWWCNAACSSHQQPRGWHGLPLSHGETTISRRVAQQVNCLAPSRILPLLCIHAFLFKHVRQHVTHAPHQLIFTTVSSNLMAEVRQPMHVVKPVF
jgi:hypothetical protein